MTFAGQLLTGALLASVMAAAWAAPALPAPQEFYFENDALAVPVQVVAPGGDEEALVAQLLKQRERGRRPLEATVQLAGVATAQGRTELGEKLFQEALAEAPVKSSNGRMVRWNYAWNLFRRGEAEAALVQWQAAASSLRGNPSWLPPTCALALWTLGRKDEALQWYAAAVRTEPQLWSSSAHHAALLPDWRDSERATLAQIQQAWAAQPPAWP